MNERHSTHFIENVHMTKSRKGSPDYAQSFSFSIRWLCVQHNLHQQQSSHAVQGT